MIVLTYASYRWFINTNLFKIAIIAIGLYVRDPETQGMASLAVVCVVLVATLCVRPYEVHDANRLEVMLLAVVRTLG